ncbi:DUF952 domain-containing protein [Streptomyces sp. AJS327]|uniref:DUF952 domain-containing protein n=1 Tax=Streptomyces sp. AJS327 TaxID=2545265 RepID=UPI0015DE589E|nr:DUF952 domain-containing protein [Streptomyces sp. AJS327]MBA0050843.1 DUF952 domain-containing protein [Streptomyces sp. AJS327]
MTELLHITERSVWEAARADGVYEMSTRGRTLREVGFIHCSLPRQLPAVAELLYGDGETAGPRVDPAELVVLVIDGEALTAPVRWEPPVPGGEDLFPHLYGPLPLDAVVRVEPWRGRVGP